MLEVIEIATLSFSAPHLNSNNNRLKMSISDKKQIVEHWEDFIIVDESKDKPSNEECKAWIYAMQLKLKKIGVKKIKILSRINYD